MVAEGSEKASPRKVLGGTPMPIKDREARRIYAREWMAKRRSEWFSGRCCVDCGATENLQLDHVNPSTKTHHAIWSWSAARREAELQKCVPRCGDCHERKTASENSVRFTKPLVHGTLAGYEKKGCRCDLCRKACRKAYELRRIKKYGVADRRKRVISVHCPEIDPQKETA
jgi:hypothetical protein